DAGQTWTSLTAPGVIPLSDVNAGPTRVTQILFDPVDDGTVWGTIEVGGVYRSKDRGVTWEFKDKGLVAGDVHGIAVVKPPAGNKVLLATTNRGLHRSEDNGESWAFQEIPSPWPYSRSVVARPDSSGVVFLANGNGPPGNDGFLLRSRNHGKTWENAKLPGPIESTVWCIAVNADNPMLIFVCTNLGELFGSTVMTVKIPRGQGLLTKETVPAYRDSAVALAQQHFSNKDFDLIAYGCTAAGFILGPSGDADLQAKLTAATGLPVVTTARAMV